MDFAWVPIASLFGLAGSIWQAISSFASSIDSMSSFLGAHNRILKEEQERIYRDVPPWRIFRRRRLVKQSRAEAADLLTPAEDRVSRQFDREATGWCLVVVATLILTIHVWVEWFNG